MTNIAANRAATATALRYRTLAVDAFNEAQAHYEIAVLDHVTARILEAYPETTHLTFGDSSRDRTIELHGLWATHHGGTEELILDVPRDADTSALDLQEIADDLTEALAGRQSVAWSAVRPQPRPGGHRVLNLPPTDRAVRIAELVRAHHPDAQLLTVDLVRNTCRVRDIVCAKLSEFGGAIGKPVQATDELPLWPVETERQITALIQQIHALPHLRAERLARVGGPRERTAFFLLPQTSSGKE
ncbi:hypothetical protein [Streptomyces antimycoticus]|uniref:hypothetical protein n=1 Tax=Streptomyces antimycoticus TaxID=68175 RepID=UPI00381FD8A9